MIQMAENESFRVNSSGLGPKRPRAPVLPGGESGNQADRSGVLGGVVLLRGRHVAI